MTNANVKQTIMSAYITGQKTVEITPHLKFTASTYDN